MSFFEEAAITARLNDSSTWRLKSVGGCWDLSIETNTVQRPLGGENRRLYLIAPATDAGFWLWFVKRGQVEA